MDIKKVEGMTILKQMARDLKFLKQKIIVMDEELEDISNGLYEVRPEYIGKLKRIEKEGIFHTFDSVDDLRKAIEVETEEDDDI